LLSITIDQYIEAVLASSTEFDLGFKGGNEKSALDIACFLDNRKWVDAILKRGVELKYYNSDLSAAYKETIENNSPKVLKYLFEEQIENIDISEALFDCIKYGNLTGVKYYINSSLDTVKTVVDRNKKCNDKAINKYSLLNYGLLKIIHIGELNFHSKLDKEKRIEKENLAINKLKDIAGCLVEIISAKKMYFGIDKIVLNKTKLLLSQILKYETENHAVKEILNNLTEKVINEFLLNDYSSEIKEAFNKIREGSFPDDISQASIVTGFSVLSQVYKNDDKTIQLQVVGEKSPDEEYSDSE
jgi:hypothetical protein